MSAKIISARISPEPHQVQFLGPMPTVYVKVEESDDEISLFSYYPDEISFRANEFVGLTIDEARRLRHDKDVAYLRS